MRVITGGKRLHGSAGQPAAGADWRAFWQDESYDHWVANRRNWRRSSATLSGTRFKPAW